MVASENMQKPDQGEERPKVMYFLVGAVSVITVLSMSTVTAKASTLPQEVVNIADGLYNDILTIATPVAVASFVIALLISFFSHNQRAVDTSRGVAKGIVITWIVIMMAGAIFNYAAKQINSVSNPNEIPTFNSGTGTNQSGT